MKIAHVTPSFYPDVGGLATFVGDLAIRQQARNGLAVKVLVCGDQRNRTWKPINYSYSGIDVVSLPSIRIGLFYIPLGISSALSDCDIIHLHDPFFLGSTLGSILASRQKPVFMSTHGGFFHTRRLKAFKSLYARTAVPIFLRRANAVFACSRSDQATFRSMTEMRDKVVLIENGVDLTKFGRQAGMGEPNRFIYYGRFAPNKNVERLIDAFTLLSENNSRLKCDLIGEDVTGVWQQKDHKERERLSSIGLTYHGPISDAQLAPLVHRSRFFISASLYEGFGLAVVEAMAAGKIPVVNKIPSMQAIIDHGVNGYLVDFSDPGTAAKEIEAILTLPEATHNAVSVKAIASSAKYGWDAKVDEFLRQYERASFGAGEHDPRLNH